MHCLLQKPTLPAKPLLEGKFVVIPHSSTPPAAQSTHVSHPTQGNATSIPHPPQNDTGPDQSRPGEHTGNLSQNYITEDDNDWIGLFGLTEDGVPGHPDVGTNSWFHSNMES